VAVLQLPSCQHPAGPPGPALQQLFNHHQLLAPCVLSLTTCRRGAVGADRLVQARAGDGRVTRFDGSDMTMPQQIPDQPRGVGRSCATRAGRAVPAEEPPAGAQRGSLPRGADKPIGARVAAWRRTRSGTG